MRRLWLLWRRDLAAYWLGPVPYVFGASLLAVSLWLSKGGGHQCQQAQNYECLAHCPLLESECRPDPGRQTLPARGGPH